MFNTTNADNSKNLFAGIPTTAGRSLFSSPSDQSNKSLFPTSQGTSLFNPPSLFAPTIVANKPHDLFTPPTSGKLSTDGFAQPHRSVQNPASGQFFDHDGTSDADRNPTKSVPDRPSPSHWPAVKLSRLPAGLNQKQFLQRHFERFGTIQRIICQPSLDAAYIAYDSVTAAQRAKRSGHTQLPDCDQTLPSTVLMTLAQCRTRLGSDNSGDAPAATGKRKISPMKSFLGVPKSPVKTAGIRETSGPRPHKELFHHRHHHRISEPNLDFASQPKLARPEPGTAGYETAGATRPLPRFACTVDERVALLQAHQQVERRRWQRLTTVQTGAHLTESFQAESGAGFEDQALANVPTPIRGSCADMCPELERYFRELHQRVSIFECLPSTLNAGSSGWQMDHTRAVKDYERSSADQPAPLPCELRPTPVLHRTMAYLLASVADRPELDQSRNFWKPWYEFMWTRTRAIRKDVAQQRLCCAQTVGVIERIARFHIFCAARLVDQPIDSFDPRINSENLTQCLQTLKEMYNDLYGTRTIDGGQACPCEPEFRAYMLLMNLNDQSALNEVQMLPANLLRSEEIRFAVAVHEAVTTNNYIRFFRLARLATCLNACLMHRYFVQVRSRALSRLAAAFAGHPKREVQYPLETLTRQLGFEDRLETQSFCESWGLSVVDGFLMFDKQAPPQPPELAWRERRAFRLIEAKRAGIALSTLFNNGPIAPEDAQPVPVHSSFDANGRFIGPAESELESDEAKSQSDDRPPVSSQSQPEPQPALLGAANRSVLRPPFDPGAKSAPIAGRQPSEVERLLADRNVLLQFVDQWIDEAIEFEPIARQVLLAESVARVIQTELIMQVVQSSVQEVARSVLNDEQTCLVRELSLELRDSLVHETVGQEIVRLAQTSLAFESVLNDIFWSDLVPCLTHSVAKSSLLLAEADWYYERLLSRRCVQRIRAWLDHKAAEEQDRALLRSMPACPMVHLDALSLSGWRAAGRWTALRRARSAREARAIDGPALPRPDRPLGRFSCWANKVDQQVTWSPFTPTVPFRNQRIAIYLPYPSAQQQRNNLFLQLVTPWLRAKLIRFAPVILDKYSPTLSKDVCAVLCLGQPDESFSNASALHDHNLPVLVLLPPQWVEPCAPDTGDQAMNRCKYLTLPCVPNGQFVPHPGWTSVLQTGLDWLASSIIITEPPASTPAPVRARNWVSATHPVQLRLPDLVRHLFAARFFRPMAILSHEWSARGLVDPSIASLVDAYHLVLNAVLDHIHEDSLRALLRDQLHIPSGLLDQFRPESVASSPPRHAWLQFVSQWHACAQNLALDPDHRYSVDVAIERAQLGVRTRAGYPVLTLGGLNPRSELLLPDPALAPWLRVCMAIVRQRLDQLVHQVNHDWSMVGSDTLEALVTYLGESETVGKDYATNEDEAFSLLVTHFSRLGEPTMRISKAIDNSVEAFRQKQISVQLDAEPIPGRLNCTSSDLKTRLDLLSSRLDEVECSMLRTLEETEARSLTSSHSHSLSRRHSNRQ